jgi:hypothetical protein
MRWIPRLEMLECLGALILAIQIQVEEYQVRGRCLAYFFKRGGKREYRRDFDWG